MKRTFQLLFVAAVLNMLAAALGTHLAFNGLSTLRGTFFRWAAYHGKSYSTIEEIEFRFE